MLYLLLRLKLSVVLKIVILAINIIIRLLKLRYTLPIRYYIIKNYVAFILRYLNVTVLVRAKNRNCFKKSLL
jgi:hypothetical protein